MVYLAGQVAQRKKNPLQEWVLETKYFLEQWQLKAECVLGTFNALQLVKKKQCANYYFVHEFLIFLDNYSFFYYYNVHIVLFCK